MSRTWHNKNQLLVLSRKRREWWPSMAFLLFRSFPRWDVRWPPYPKSVLPLAISSLICQVPHHPTNQESMWAGINVHCKGLLGLFGLREYSRSWSRRTNWPQVSVFGSCSFHSHSVRQYGHIIIEHHWRTVVCWSQYWIIERSIIIDQSRTVLTNSGLKLYLHAPPSMISDCWSRYHWAVKTLVWFLKSEWSKIRPVLGIEVLHWGGGLMVTWPIVNV